VPQTGAQKLRVFRPVGWCVQDGIDQFLGRETVLVFFKSHLRKSGAMFSMRSLALKGSLSPMRSGFAWRWPGSGGGLSGFWSR
jgi:hypothetical protein